MDMLTGRPIPTGSSAPPADDSPDELYALWDDAVERSPCYGSPRPSPTVGRASSSHAHFPRTVATRAFAGSLCDLIEEYGRHTGQADLIREAVDGPVGESHRLVGTPRRELARRPEPAVTPERP